MTSGTETFDTGLTRADLAEKAKRFVQTPWGPFALYVDGERVFCLQPFCPHMDGPLFEGSIADGEVTCPWHGWRYRLETGERTDEPDPEECLRTCAVREGKDGRIVLEAPRLR